MPNEQNGGFWQGQDDEDVLSEADAAAVLAGETIPQRQVENIPAEPVIEAVADQVMEDFQAQSEESEEVDDPESVRLLMSDARLRIAQARLYEMLLEHNLFQDVDAPPEAVKNVEKEIKRYIRERLEILLGIRPDPRLAPARTVQAVGQFSQFEVDVLKRLVSRASVALPSAWLILRP